MADGIDLERLKDFIPFDDLADRHLRDVFNNLTVHKFDKGKLVFKRGSKSPDCYFLLKGAVDLADADFNVEKLAADSEDNYIALDNVPVHSVSCITTEPSVLVSISRDQLDMIVTWSQAFDSFDETKQLEDDVDWMDALLSSGIFSEVPPAHLQQLFVKFREMPVTAGEKVINEGDEGDRFYVIKEGKAIVTNKATPRDEALAAFQMGDYFGQDALISDSTRNATVTMVTDGGLMYLEKEDFLQLLHSPVIQSIDHNEYLAMLDEGEVPVVLVDVRSPAEYRQDRHPNSKNLPLAELRSRYKELDSDFTYITYCGGGRRCEIGAHILQQFGYTALALRDQLSPESEQSSDEDMIIDD